ncbi:hypothetical protein FQR65_LT08808 [Abscondita terminalis]|nr:hypothetical protein FQR65_LT08808 [Abscondita terminalis]
MDTSDIVVLPLMTCVVLYYHKLNYGQTVATWNYEVECRGLNIREDIILAGVHNGKTNKEEVKDKKIRFSNISIIATTRSSILEFPDAPPRHVIKVLEFNQENEYFGVFSDLMAYLQPSSFPLDFLKDVMRNHMPIHLIIYKAIKIEGRVLAWLFMWLILSLALPCAVIAQSCCTAKGMERLHDNYSISSDQYRNTKLKIIAIVMHILLMLLLINIALMLATNEQISRTTSTAPKTITTMFEDVEAFVDNTQMQISTVTTSSVQIAVEAVRMDLEGAEELLGKPLLQALDEETGLQAAIQALTDLTAVTAELSLRVSALIKDCSDARNVRKSLQGSLIELSKLLTATRQGCLSRDQPLCDTLQTERFNVLLHVDQIASDRKLRKIMELGNNENFNRTIKTAQHTFEGLPKRVLLETSASRTEIRSILNKHRNELYDSIQYFEDTTNTLKEKLRGYKGILYNVLENISVKDFWRWALVLGLCVLAFFVWSFLICGAPCGCDPTPKTTLFLRTGLGLTCTLSLIMWIFGALSFLIGSHCHALVCRPLYEDPTYLTLNDLFNTKTIISREEGDILNYLFKNNKTIRVNNILGNCKTNHTAFYTFSLNNLLNVDVLTDSYHWRDLQTSLKKFPTILNNFEILTPELLHNLQEISTLSTANLTSYRINISHPITNKDLNALSDQLKRIAKQISNGKTAAEMENLAIKAQNLSNTEYKELKHIRDEILYKMAALEVFLIPFNKQVVQSLSHLRTTQYFINNEGVEIAKKVCAEYVYNINHKMQEMFEYVKKKVYFEIGNCRPLWDVYDNSRNTVCKQIVDPINGFSCACFLCILLFLGLAPVVIQTVAEYKDSEYSLNSCTHRRARNGMLINDECTWATPSIR